MYVILASYAWHKKMIPHIPKLGEDVIFHTPLQLLENVKYLRLPQSIFKLYPQTV